MKWPISSARLPSPRAAVALGMGAVACVLVTQGVNRDVVDARPLMATEMAATFGGDGGCVMIVPCRASTVQSFNCSLVTSFSTCDSENETSVCCENPPACYSECDVQLNAGHPCGGADQYDCTCSGGMNDVGPCHNCGPCSSPVCVLNGECPVEDDMAEGDDCPCQEEDPDPDP